MIVSIIIPIYNVEPYIERCLLSVMNQTMTKGVECIIVDDCGQDNSMEIVKRMVSEYDGEIKFHILHHEHNRGLSAARNTGIDAAKGDYIYFLDSDDWIIPECIELMVAKVIEHPGSQMVFAGSKTTSGGFVWLDYEKKNLPDYSDDKEWLQYSMLRRYDFGMTTWNKLMSKSFVVKNSLRFVEGLVYEDEVWNFDVSKYIQSASFVTKNTYIYNIHPNSIVTSVTKEVRWKWLFNMWNVVSSKIINERKNIMIKGIVHLILDNTKKDFPNEHKLSLCLLFFKLGIKSCNRLSFLLFIQGMLALFYSSKYNNHKICSRIGL